MSRLTIRAGALLTVFSALFFALDAQAAIPLTERDALIALYDSTGGDSWSAQSNWRKSPGVFNDSGTECTWFGVHCDEAQTSVIHLSLSRNQLTGAIPPELGNLANLKNLSLSNNQLTGSIPPELGNLANLQSLALWNTQLTGSIPPELGNLANLQDVYLSRNQLTGAIPPELGNLANLKNLSLSNNQLTGSIPPELGNLANLKDLILDFNQLTGPIPPELGNLANLQFLYLQDNQLTGSIPPELGNLANLQFLYLQDNQLTGSIPPELGNLANLQGLGLLINQLTGSIPPELGNLTSLEYVYLSFNQLTGSIPPELGTLANLKDLFLENNQLTGAIPPELGNLANLQSLALWGNQLTGAIPPELGSLANLQYVYLSANQLTGSIPPELSKLANLIELYLDYNQLTGPLPPELSNLANLQTLSLRNNQLTGSIPPELGNLANLRSLALGNNQLTGAIPPEFGDLANLQSLHLAYNQLTGPIPPELGNLANLRSLALDYNQLTGAIPPELGDLANLTYITLSSNELFTDSNGLRAFLNARHDGGDWESSQTLRRYFAHFGDGAGLFSQVVLFNLNDGAAARGQIEIRGPAGEALAVDLNGEPGDGKQDISVPASGMLSLSTDGLGPVQVGSVRVTTDRHVEGVVIFGGTFGLAGVGGSPEFPSGFVAPMQRDASRGINTGIAVTVLGKEDAALGLTLLNADGSTVANASDVLVNRGHAAFFVTEIPWDAAVDFSQFSGTLVVTSSQPVTATVIQTRPGEFITLPVAPLESAATQEASAAEHSLYFAQFADGLGALASQILLFNLSDQELATAQVTLRDNGGQLLSVDLEGEVVAGETQVEIGPRALKSLATDGLGDLQVGSVAVTSDQPLAGVILFAGPAVGAAGVGSSAELPEGFVAPMERDQSRSINTGIALMNLETTEMTIEASLLGSDGQLLASSQLVLAPQGHAALYVTDFQWDNPVDFSQFQGLLRVKAGGRTAATVIQTRPGQFATMPVAPKPID